MNRTVSRFLALVLALLVIPAALFAAPRTPKKKKAAATIKLGTLAPKASSFHKILQNMGQKWTQAPNGGVELKIYPGGTLGGEADMVRLMGAGQLDAALFTVTGLSEIDDSVDALQSMPMMFRSLDEVDYVGEKLRPRLEKNLRSKGFVVLFWVDAGWVRFFSTKPVVRPADLKKLKLFTWAGDVNAVDIYKAAGYRPVPLETNDILPGLRTGMVDAVPLPPYIALTTQVNDAAKHMLELNWAPLVGGLVVTERAWKKIKPETQAALARAAGEAGIQMKQRNRFESDQAVVEMTRRGLTVHKVTPEIETEWRKAAETSYPQVRGKVVPAELFDEVKRLLAEYRAKPPAKKTAAK